MLKNQCKFNSSRMNDAYMCQQIMPSLVEIMSCCLYSAKPLSEPMLVYCQVDLQNIFQWNVNQKYLIISWYLHVWNGVAVAAYSRLASRSQAKFHTKKLSPLVRPCAAAPAQSTTSAYRSLDFRRATSSQWGRWVGSWPLLLRSIHEDTS